MTVVALDTKEPVDYIVSWDGTTNTCKAKRIGDMPPGTKLCTVPKTNATVWGNYGHPKLQPC